MMEIRVGENESLESALKRFKRKFARSGVLAEVRRRQHYEKPSVKPPESASINSHGKPELIQAIVLSALEYLETRPSSFDPVKTGSFSFAAPIR